jgi:hypothetical protein
LCSGNGHILTLRSGPLRSARCRSCWSTDGPRST